MQFYDFLLHRIELAARSTEDVLSSFLPLVREVIEAHREETVAPLEGLAHLHVDGSRIWFEQARRLPIRRNTAELARVELFYETEIEILEERRRTSDSQASNDEMELADVGVRGQPITRPVFLPGYVSWEHELDHHDPLTDVFSLGMILASLACGLDLNDPKDVRRFAENRRNLFAINAELDPALAHAILKMTELDRRRRSQDLSSVLLGLENYRDQAPALDIDLARLPGLQSRDVKTRSHVVLSKLRDRLFDVSRRNSLLHFRPTLGTVNLTQASIPLMLDLRAIREDQLFIWNDQLRNQLVEGTSISLNKHLNFTEALYLPPLLERILSDARRDQQEFGFAQLRLVVCFLSWANLKVKPAESYLSPLILVAVKLSKTKGVRDTYHLEALSPLAEVNPVVRHQFRQLYNIQLPETIDLEANGLDSLFEYLEAQVRASEPGVMLQRIDRPRIDVVHEKARRRLDQYRRSARVSGRGVRTLFDLDYSYDPVTFHPLGLKLFLAKAQRPVTRIGEILQESPPPRQFAVPDIAPDMAERERSFFQLRDSTEVNPYLWNFDLCSLTLANLRYRRMSLVRDFEAILDEERTNPAFNATFSLDAKPIPPSATPALPLSDRFDVVPCDPTQAAAIAAAREGASYIIQGPPGTGKSQTIANLIADFAARGLRVLFVCEKRAAIDVVFARLRQRGLEALCCLVHDSQTDKKEFVLDLKRTYEALLEPAETKSTNDSRKVVLTELQRQLSPFEHFQSRMLDDRLAPDLPLRQFLGRCVGLLRQEPELTAEQQEQFPTYDVWWAHRERLGSLEPLIEELQPEGILARYPLRHLSPLLSDLDHPLQRVSKTLPQGREQLQSLLGLLRKLNLPAKTVQSFAEVKLLRQYAVRLAPLTKNGNLAFLDPSSESWKAFRSATDHVRRRAATLDAARQLTVHWIQKLPPRDLVTALEQARRWESRPLAFLNPGWWRLRSVLNRSYEFHQHSLRPTWVQILSTLEKEYDAAHDYELTTAEVMSDLRLESPPQEVANWIQELNDWIAGLPEPIRRCHESLLRSPDGNEKLSQLLAAEPWLSELDTGLDAIVVDYMDLPLEVLDSMLGEIAESVDEVPQALHLLSEISQLPVPLSRMLRQWPFTLGQAEAAIARRTWDSITRSDRELRVPQHKARARRIAQAESSYDSWLFANANHICEEVRRQFLEHVYVSNASAAQLSPEQKELKKVYLQGRRILEHEFGKSMRFRAIRDLVDGDSGIVVRDLKRVWLMSPLSVSDTLPLDSDFDVVIFDEASQVPLEDSVPSLFRGRQTIVVGDEMQLPPTDFFSLRRSDEDASEFSDGGQRIRVDLESDSLLNHAAKNLRSTMLGWHYRSRSESLISFSNWAFYDGRLLTVPEERLPPRDATQNNPCGHLLTRPLSFHFIANGIYENRRNRAEAEHVARIVRDLLREENGMSIGVVAFSEAQQDEINSALERLGQEDPAFRQLYENELIREVDGQFSGLLVKNLENIQGDERDVVILSVCYGPGPNGKMLMNFGPINQSGGEKRLNVAFSRAKKHMAVISSIRSPQITNDYNLGANCLKSYLKYAEAVSSGDAVTANRVLSSFTRLARHEDVTTEFNEPLVAEIATALTSRGYSVEPAIGQSHFRVDLAVHAADKSHFQLGILVDSLQKYQRSSVLERELMRPRLLREFGWNVISVLAKDWYEDRESELRRILEMLDSNEAKI